MITSRFKVSTGLAWALVLLAASGFSQSPAGESVEADMANARVRRFLGMAVENRDGARLGVIKDFVVDFHTGRIDYAVLSTSGVLGLRAQLTVVPVRALSTATVKQRTLALDISKVRWNDAPRFRKKDLQLLCERTRVVQLFEFYGLPVPARENTPRPKEQLRFATGLIGAQVAGRQGEPVGKVSGLLVDITGQRPAMVVTTLGAPAVNKPSYAAPLRSLALAGSDRMKLDVSPAMFQQAQILTPKTWLNAADRGNVVYRCE